MDHWKALGVILILEKDRKALLSKGYGTTKVVGGEPVTSNTKTTVASVTKTFNSVVFTMQVEEGS